MDVREIDRTAPEWKALWTLFGAFLNQDLDEDYGDPWEAVAAYRRLAGTSAAESAVAARKLVAETADDDEAGRAAKKLGLEYNPESQGYTYRTWLLELATFLESNR